MKNKLSRNYHVYLFCFYLLIWIALAIKPVDRFTWFLENIAVFIFIPIIVVVHYKIKLSNISYTLITLFLILHAIGAHYTYSQTPFFSSLFGHKLQRDHYDRVTHFTFGLLMYYPVREFIMKFVNMKSFWSYYTPWAIVVSFSALYELTEWITAIVVSPENAIAFMGIQGDIFDTQKDMLLAATGALISAVIIFINNIKYNKDKHKV